MITSILVARKRLTVRFEGFCYRNQLLDYYKSMCQNAINRFLGRATEWFYLRTLRFFTSKILGDATEGNGVLLRDVKFLRDVSIGPRGSVVNLPVDSVIYNRVSTFGDWEAIEAEFLARELSAFSSTRSAVPILLDLGANVGLVSMQICRRIDTRVQPILVEALPMHLISLRRNFKVNFPNLEVKICPFALGRESGVIDFFTETGNQGNSSASLQAMQDSSFYKTQVEVRSPRDFYDSYIESMSPIFLKSDLQGFEPEVLGGFPESFWSSLQAGVIEIWATPNISKSDVDHVMTRLDASFRISWDANLRVDVPRLEVIRFWQSSTFEHRNLFFRKATAKGEVRR